MPFDISALMSNPWLIIALVVYMILPADGKIKQFINSILSNIVKPTPTPTPGPGPTPGPVPVLDLNAILQLLMSMLLKAKAAGDSTQQAAILATIEAVQAEQMAAAKSSLPSNLFIIR